MAQPNPEKETESIDAPGDPRTDAPPIPSDHLQNACKPTILLQELCRSHKYIRTHDDSAIVERPERLRSVAIGLSGAIARLEQCIQILSSSLALTSASDDDTVKTEPQATAGDELAQALEGLTLSSPAKPISVTNVVDVIKSASKVDLATNPAVKFVHGDIDGPGYIDQFISWASESHNKIANGGSEIPEGLNQGDLYLCPESLDAVSGALGTVCEAVDLVVNGTASNKTTNPQVTDNSEQQSNDPLHAFVLIRPPGHHCGEDTPSGFCFVNNVMVAAAHAHLKHNINRVIVLDIDLHHGNGTQSIAWSINEETYRKELEHEGREDATASAIATQGPKGLKVFYGSLHDILSFPCEDGNPALIQAASTSLHGPHGQWIENQHLVEYTTDEEFYKNVYPRYLKLLDRARDFAESMCQTEEVLVFISCGFDASVHEYPSMSRHGRRVPTSFYHRFTSDICDFASTYAKGRVVSVLEGGYSLRALSSGAFAHLFGLVNPSHDVVDDSFWSVENLTKLEKVTGAKTRRSSVVPPETWLQRSVEVLAVLDPPQPKSATNRLKTAEAIPERRSTREKKKPPVETPPVSKRSTQKGATKKTDIASAPPDGIAALPSEPLNLKTEELPPSEKKVPRVILRVNPPKDLSSDS
ncbi:Arginase/deacetylase [Sistotremastrum suecicum HHB10207 ss-3]|uniref:Arginase/deacetylase n=1 Tax=Sistotremastrum suecicum HHB10207 ss-3 TaxID=1314776 RepID=A0A166DUC8_9AGAM|nr:Arginase/deacetylase [Sistotremastrum suecicum HHB10207 ss-3]